MSDLHATITVDEEVSETLRAVSDALRESAEAMRDVEVSLPDE